MLAEILAEDRYNYCRQNGDVVEVLLQVCVPTETITGKAICRSVIVGIKDADFECIGSDTFDALCGAIRLMKEWVFERYMQGDRLCWIAEDDNSDEEYSGSAPLWLLFSCRSKMTESDKVAAEEMSVEFETRVLSEKTEIEQHEYDERKARAREIRTTPITNVAAVARYYSVTPKGQQTPSGIILERPFTDELGDPVVRFTMTTWYPYPYSFSGLSTLSALIAVLRLGWFLLLNGCTLHNTTLFRDAGSVHRTNPGEIYNHLFQAGD